MRALRLGFSFTFSFFVLVTGVRAETLQVVASTTDLAAIANEIGGEHVAVEVLCRSSQDPHGFEILPQHVLAVRRASVYLKVGAGLDFWVDELIKAAANSELVVVDCSRNIALIHDAEEHNNEHEHGHHSHEQGNPHYLLGPENIPAVAQTIAEGMASAQPEHEREYLESVNQFTMKWRGAMTEWKTMLQPCAGAGMVTYHRTWDYLARGFNLRIVGTIEPQPGTEPSPVTLALLEREIGAEHARILLAEPFASLRWADVLGHDTGIAVVVVAPSVEDAYVPDALLTHFDQLVKEIRARCRVADVEHE